MKNPRSEHHATAAGTKNRSPSGLLVWTPNTKPKPAKAHQKTAAAIWNETRDPMRSLAYRTSGSVPTAGTIDELLHSAPP